jgi:hypothetical protein
MRATRANAIRDALLPELRRRFWEDGRLHHPLIIEEILNCEGANRANERYLQKMERLRELRTDPGDGSKYVWLHERAYRFGALRRIGPRLKEATHYWSLVGEVWTDGESIHKHFVGWQRVWSDPRPHKRECMTPEEQAALEGMPASFPVWRGVGLRGRVQGLSWTTDYEKAAWFARRFDQGRGRLIHGEVRRRDVHAFFQSRDESEIVTSDVRVFKVERLRTTIVPG